MENNITFIIVSYTILLISLKLTVDESLHYMTFLVKMQVKEDLGAIGGHV